MGFLTLTLCLVGVILGKMENIERKIFLLFGKERKIEREENPGENFLSWAHKFRLPTLEGKA